MKNLRRVLSVGAVGLLGMACLLGNTAYSAEPELPEGKKWKLVWSDEFDGSKLDESKWGHARPVTTEYRDGYLTKDAVYLDGKGHLLIRVYEKGGKYYSGMINTKGKFESKYGYWVARCKLPKQEGHWCAFWIQSPTMHTTVKPGTSEAEIVAQTGTEIDIMEYPVVVGKACHHIHWRKDSGKFHPVTPERNQSAGYTPDIPGLSEGYHTFAVEWTPKEYVFYIDGKITWRTGKAISPRNEYIILGEEIASWGGKIENAKLPDFFEVDYVRVYEIAD